MRDVLINHVIDNDTACMGKGFLSVFKRSIVDYVRRNEKSSQWKVEYLAKPYSTVVHVDLFSISVLQVRLEKQLLVGTFYRKLKLRF